MQCFSPSTHPTIQPSIRPLTRERSGPCVQAWRGPAVAGVAAAADPDKGSCVEGPGTDLGGRRSDSSGDRLGGLLVAVE